MFRLIKDLCSYRTSVVSDENEKLFKRINDEIPINILKVKSDTEHNGWVVPKKWKVKKAKIFRNGKLIFDANLHYLGVGYYSKSFKGKVSYNDLKKKIVTNKKLPTAYMFHCEWQYRPWAADWRIVIPHNKFKEFPKSGEYFVDLETTYEDGEMLIGVAEVKGKTDKVIVLNSNNCHPGMANDGFAGTTVLIEIMKFLSSVKPFYTYRLIIAPEHLGSVFYLRSMKKSEISKIIFGIFEEMPGTKGKIRVTKSFKGENYIDLAFKNVLNCYFPKTHIISGWREGAGNDETVWESPGYEIPFVELTRCESTFKPYKEYHSSLDTPELMNLKKLEEFIFLLKKVIFIFENNFLVKRKFNGLICLSNPKYNLYFEREDPTIKKNLKEDSEIWGKFQDHLPRYLDGNFSILDIANKFNLSFEDLFIYLSKFKEKNLVSFKRIF